MNLQNHYDLHSPFVSVRLECIDGIEYTANCPCTSSYDFFKEFSEVFAKAAVGTIFYAGFGEHPDGVFPANSFSAKHEFPLLASGVNHVVVLVMHARRAGMFVLIKIIGVTAYIVMCI